MSAVSETNKNRKININICKEERERERENARVLKCGNVEMISSLDVNIT